MADVDMLPSLTFCDLRKQSARDQQVLENYVFTGAYNAREVEQVAPTFIRVKFYTFQFKKQLGKGGHGSVFLLEDKLQAVYLALKCADSDEESKIAVELLESGCHVLRERPVGKPIFNPVENKYSSYAYFMELADGTLKDYFNKLPSVRPDLLLSPKAYFSHFLGIAEEVRKQMVCIFNYNNSYVYTDMKLENVLYKCDSPDDLNQVRFILGDLGSAVPGGSNYVATFPPYEFKSSNGSFPLTTKPQKLAAMAWGLGILLLEVVAGNSREFRNMAYDRISLMDQAQYKFLYKNLKSAFGKDVAALLNLDTQTRRSILKPLQ